MLGQRDSKSIKSGIVIDFLKPWELEEKISHEFDALDFEYVLWRRESITKGYQTQVPYKGQYCFVIREDGKIRGGIAFSNKEINALYIDKEHRNKGYGTLLVNFASQLFVANVTVESEPKAQNFWSKFGKRIGYSPAGNMIIFTVNKNLNNRPDPNLMSHHVRNFLQELLLEKPSRDENPKCLIRIYKLYLLERKLNTLEKPISVEQISDPKQVAKESDREKLAKELELKQLARESELKQLAKDAKELEDELNELKERALKDAEGTKTGFLMVIECLRERMGDVPAEDMQKFEKEIAKRMKIAQDASQITEEVTQLRMKVEKIIIENTEQKNQKLEKKIEEKGEGKLSSSSTFKIFGNIDVSSLPVDAARKEKKADPQKEVDPQHLKNKDQINEGQEIAGDNINNPDNVDNRIKKSL